MTAISHTHHFIPGSNPCKPPLVLLHGAGGDEHELVRLAADLAPESPILAVRGGIPFDGGVRVLPPLARPVDRRSRYRLTCPDPGGLHRGRQHAIQAPRAPIAIGYSNGASMAAALLLMRPGLLAGAVLFRPLSPFRDDLPTRLDGTPILIIDGEKDSRRSPGDGARLAERMICAGATVTHHVLPVGHSM
jgi:phospholipase/carboxylesterase